MPINNPRLVQESHFSSGGSHGSTRPFDTHVFLHGTASEDDAAPLILAAADTCYAHRALSVDISSSRTVDTILSESA